MTYRWPDYYEMSHGFFERVKKFMEEESMKDDKQAEGRRLYGVALEGAKGGETFFTSKLTAEQTKLKVQPFNDRPLKVVEVILFTPLRTSRPRQEDSGGGVCNRSTLHHSL